MDGLQGTKKMAEDVTKAKPLALREQGSAARCLCLSVVGRPSPEMLGSVSKVATGPQNSPARELPRLHS